MGKTDEQYGNGEEWLKYKNKNLGYLWLQVCWETLSYMQRVTKGVVHRCHCQEVLSFIVLKVLFYRQRESTPYRSKPIIY